MKLLSREKQDRLTEITVEYSRLRAAFEREGLSNEQKITIWGRMQILKNERVAILGE